MVTYHSKSFYGQSAGIILISRSKFEPYVLLKFVKKKKDGTWENYSDNEGKQIKLDLEDLIT
jgi:hypothetical protein